MSKSGRKQQVLIVGDAHAPRLLALGRSRDCGPALLEERNAGFSEAPGRDPEEPGISRQQRRWRARQQAKRSKQIS